MLITQNLCGLSLKFCFLDLNSLYIFNKGLARNRTLVTLDLSCVALSSFSGIEIAKILKENITLVHLNLSKN